jgi:pimeloyl-ACP methyl ester carboxylesterase
MISIARKFIFSLLRILVVLALVLLFCQRWIIYHPRGYDDSTVLHARAKPLPYTTSQGRQVAWITSQGTDKPERVWLVFCGNGTVALDYDGYFGLGARKGDLMVLVDYPGYGRSEGRPSPEAIAESIRAVVPAVAEKLGMPLDELRPRLRAFGHSLGCAAALVAMDMYGIKNGVLVAPFTSMLDMSFHVVGWPLCHVLLHRFDNVAALERLRKAGGVHLRVFHGTADEVIPVTMGKKLAALFPDMIQFEAVTDARHNEIIETDRRSLVAAMAEMR